MKQDSRVLIVDDFMKAGGTVMGMISMLEEFNGQLAGIAVLVEAEKIQERLVDEYTSLVQLSNVDVKEKKINVQAGNFLTK
jgi:purine operon repressor